MTVIGQYTLYTNVLHQNTEKSNSHCIKNRCLRSIWQTLCANGTSIQGKGNGRWMSAAAGLRILACLCDSDAWPCRPNLKLEWTGVFTCGTQCVTAVHIIRPWHHDPLFLSAGAILSHLTPKPEESADHDDDSGHFVFKHKIITYFKWSRRLSY